VENVKWVELVHTLKEQWRVLWRDRIDDRVRAEGIASEDYEMLFVDRGSVIVATRDYKPPDFRDILERHIEDRQTGRVIASDPRVGGWGEFIRGVISKQKRFTKWGRPFPAEPEKRKQQLKKGGRGWLHRF